MGENGVRSFRDLDAWKVAVDLTVLAYELSNHLPASERFELSSQMRRAAASIPANIAEGHACGEDGRYIHHLRIALGSLGELATHIEVARRLQMFSPADGAACENQLARAGQLLHGLLRSRRMKRLARRGSRLALLACLGLYPTGLLALG